jgi:hypothetical protein
LAGSSKIDEPLNSVKGAEFIDRRTIISFFKMTLLHKVMCLTAEFKEHQT